MAQGDNIGIPIVTDVSDTSNSDQFVWSQKAVNILLSANVFSGGTVNGTTYFTNGLYANTISATTYFGLPTNTLQSVYTASTQPQITLTSTLGSFQVKGYDGPTALNIESKTSGGTTTWMVNAGGGATGTSFTKSGGTSNQYLMADGSVITKNSSFIEEILVKNTTVVTSTTDPTTQQLLLSIPISANTVQVNSILELQSMMVKGTASNTNSVELYIGPNSGTTSGNTRYALVNLALTLQAGVMTRRLFVSGSSGTTAYVLNNIQSQVSDSEIPVTNASGLTSIPFNLAITNYIIITVTHSSTGNALHIWTTVKQIY